MAGRSRGETLTDLCGSQCGNCQVESKPSPGWGEAGGEECQLKDVVGHVTQEGLPVGDGSSGGGSSHLAVRHCDLWGGVVQAGA